MATETPDSSLPNDSNDSGNGRGIEERPFSQLSRIDPSEIVAERDRANELAGEYYSKLLDLERQRELDELKHSYELDKLRLELQAKEKEKERNYKLQDKKLDGAIYAEKVQLWYRLGLSGAAFIVGAVFVITGHEAMGSFLLGGGLSVITSNAVDLMKTVRSKGNDTE